MTTNPSNIVRVRARNGGRASVLEANAWCQAYSTGLLEGRGVVQNTVPDMTVLVGGTVGKPDVVIAETPEEYRIALDIVGQQPVTLTAPPSGEQVNLIVAYTDDVTLPSSDSDVTGSPSSCGLITVKGTVGESAAVPDDDAIRSAISDDNATGSQAAYAVLAQIVVSSTATTIEDKDITNLGSRILPLPRVIYESSEDTIKRSIELGSPLTDFRKIVVTAHEHNHPNDIASSFTFPTNEKIAEIVLMNMSSTKVFTTYGCQLSLSGSTITFVGGGAIAFNESGGKVGFTSDNEIIISKVVGEY